MRAAATRALLAALALGLLGCVPTEFEDLRATSQTRDLAPPDGYPRTGFGRVVAGYGGMFFGTSVSRAAGSAGADSPFTVYPVFIGDEVRLDTPILDGCDTETPCEPGSSAALVGMPAWDGREMCIATASMTIGEVKIRCEDDSTRFSAVPGPGGVRFGFSGAGLREDHPFGRAIFGAPGASAVYRLPDGSAPVELDLSGGDGAGGELGHAVAIAAVDGDTVVLAASAPVGAVKRVVVATSDAAPDGSIGTSVRDCLDAGAEGWGEALALGDLDGDGAPDLVIGGGESGGERVLRVYAGAAMPAAGTCDGSWPVALELTCPSVEGIECDAGGFGASLAIGDLDGDGVGDLLAGAPAADVDEVGGAGAVFVFSGGELGTLGSTDRVAALRHSSPEAGAELGASLAVAPGLFDAGARRDEAVVGAPGADRVYVFLCSGLDGDSEATTAAMSCQPREP